MRWALLVTVGLATVGLGAVPACSVLYDLDRHRPVADASELPDASATSDAGGAPDAGERPVAELAVPVLDCGETVVAPDTSGSLASAGEALTLYRWTLTSPTGAEFLVAGGEAGAKFATGKYVLNGSTFAAPVFNLGQFYRDGWVQFAVEGNGQNVAQIKTNDSFPVESGPHSLIVTAKSQHAFGAQAQVRLFRADLSTYDLSDNISLEPGADPQSISVQFDILETYGSAALQIKVNSAETFWFDNLAVVSHATQENVLDRRYFDEAGWGGWSSSDGGWTISAFLDEISQGDRANDLGLFEIGLQVVDSADLESAWATASVEVTACP